MFGKFQIKNKLQHSFKFYDLQVSVDIVANQYMYFKDDRKDNQFITNPL